MKGHQLIAKLTDHYRKYTGAQERQIVFGIHGRPERYRVATVKPDGKRTLVTLVEEE